MASATIRQTHPLPGRLPMRRIAPRPLGTFWGDSISFLLAALSGAYFPFVGMIPYSEVLALALLPILLVSFRDRIFRKEYQTVYVLLVVWFIAQIVSDFVNDMPLQNRAKGLARIVFFAMDFAAASAIVGRSARRVRLFFLGTLVDGCIAMVSDRARGALRFSLEDAPCVVCNDGGFGLREFLEKVENAGCRNRFACCGGNWTAFRFTFRSAFLGRNSPLGDWREPNRKIENCESKYLDSNGPAAYFGHGNGVAVRKRSQMGGSAWKAFRGRDVQGRIAVQRQARDANWRQAGNSGGYRGDQGPSDSRIRFLC